MPENELTRKAQHQLTHDWEKLVECNVEEGRAITAAQFAQFLGIARSTAMRRLITLVEYEGAITFRLQGKNRFPKIVYEAAGRGTRWSYAYGDYDLPDSEAL